MNKIKEINNEKIIRIIKTQIERNFGALEINIDFEGDIGDKKELEKYRISIYKNCLEIFSEPKKWLSSQIFKIIYNIYCKHNEEPEYIMSEEDIENFDYIGNIIDNIKDNECRYLLIKIKPSQALLVHQLLSKQLNYKIYYYERSPFDKDNNIEYLSNIINKISEHMQRGDIILLHNFYQIFYILNDLFDKKFIINDDKQYIRIQFSNLKGNLLLVQKEFKIIILDSNNNFEITKTSLFHKCEKILLDFSRLMNDQENLYYSIINELNIENFMKKLNYKINYNLTDLLILNCKEDILAMIYYELESNKNLIEDNTKEIIINNIYKLLPEDIIIHLDARNQIKKSYNSKKQYYNLNQYLDINPVYKITIIYTFNSTVSEINCINKSSNLIMISEIENEKQLNKIMSEKAFNKLKYKSKNYIFIHFYDSDFNKVNFLINFVLNNYNENKNIKFIFIVCIKRNFSNDSKITYAFPDIHNIVYNLFIDNLNGPNIKLNDIVKNPIQYQNFIDLEYEFKKALDKFNEHDLENNEKFKKLKEHFNNDINLKYKIIEKIKSYINEKENLLNFDNIIKNIYDLNFINENSIELISVVIKFIKEEIIYKNIYYILSNLKEENNIMTDLYKENEINKNKNKEIFKKKNDDDLNKIKEENIKLKNENKKLKEIISKGRLDLKEKEYLLSLIIKTKDEKVLFSLIRKITDKFIKVEEEFYERYPEYLECKGEFRLRNNIIDKNKTLEESKLKNSDIIIFNQFQKNEINENEDEDESEDEYENEDYFGDRD